MLRQTSRLVRHARLARGGAARQPLPGVAIRAFAAASGGGGRVPFKRSESRTGTKAWVIQDLEQITNEAVTLKMVSAFQAACIDVVPWDQF